MDPSTCDVDMMKLLIQKNKVFLMPHLKYSHSQTAKHSPLPLFFSRQDSERSLLNEPKVKLEDVTFDIQCFISENTQFLSPARSSHLLKSLSSAQREFRDQAETLASQRSAWDVVLDTREREEQEKVCLRTYEKTPQFTFLK